MQFEGNFLHCGLWRQIITAMTDLMDLPPQLQLEFNAGRRLMNTIVSRDKARRTTVSRKTLVRSTGRSGLYQSGCHANLVDLGAQALFKLCMRQLQQQPLRMWRDEKSTLHLRVLDTLDYQINRECKQIHSRPADRKLRWMVNELGEVQNIWVALNYHPIDVLTPLRTPLWLQFLAFRTDGICPQRDMSFMLQQLLWPQMPNALQLLHEICNKTYRWLCKEPAFVRLRSVLAYWLVRGIGTEIVDLALHIRKRPHEMGLDARDVCRVWRFPDMFWRLCKENPKLLPVFNLWLDAHSYSGQGERDAVPLLRQSLLDDGLAPRTWRYLAAYGVRCLRARRGAALTWQGLTNVLRELQRLDWPEAVPLGFLGVLRDAAGTPADQPSYPHNAPWWFWQWMCREAAAVRHDPKAYPAFVVEMVELAQLVHKFKPEPDSNQHKRGLRWLRAWAQQMQATQQLSSHNTWSVWLQDMPWSQIKSLQIVPLLSERAVWQEAQALHNCADRYVGSCEREECLLLSMRHPASGKRVALMSLMRQNDAPERWELEDLAGPCNQMVSSAVRELADAVVRLVNAHLDRADRQRRKNSKQRRNGQQGWPQQLELWPRS